VTHAINLIILVIMTLANLVMAFIGFIDSLLAGLMTSLGIPPNAQIIILVVAAIFLIISAVRLLGGIFAGLIILLLVLLLLHRVFPGMEVHTGHTTTWLPPPPTQPHTQG
jgi:Na+-translocating ferredoxin:NAD+ oxidoreductase RnfD subunit